MNRALLALGLALLTASFAAADEAAAFFDDSTVREIHIYFDDANWYNTLYQSHQSDPDDPYFPARIVCGSVEIPKIGVRFKGESSFRRNGVKKSFKLDFNEYNDDATFFGLKKLNLNNGDLQPDFLHEKLFLDFASKYIPALRAVHVRVYVNDAYYGLYIAIEQPDKTMMKSRFGDDESGNLYEAGESVSATMAYLGTDVSAYTSRYELKTNEDANDYSGLIEMLNVLNNTPTESLPASLEPIMDVEEFLSAMALNALYTNLESYLGAAAEYYLYDRTLDGKFVYIHWDLNETFGSTGDGTPQLSNPFIMDPFYLPTSSRQGPGGDMGGDASRPLLTKLWAVDGYKRAYLQTLARTLRDGFDETTVSTRVQELAGRIRTYVYADPNKPYTNAQFETALTTQVTANGFTTWGLTQFVRERVNYLRPLLDGYAQASDVRLNEIVTVNSGAKLDEAGEADPWVEIYNPGPGPVATNGFYLTDDLANPTKWTVPVRTLEDGDHLLIWLDGETAEGAAHAGFQLNAAGGKLYLFASSVSLASPIDAVTYPAVSSGQSYARVGYIGSNWSLTATPTPAADNIITVPTTPETPAAATGALLVNEFMADNDAAFADPDEAGAYEDWFEIYNPGTAAVDMSGMYITDNLKNPTKWQVPSGISIPAKGYLVFIADGDTSQGDRHTSWSLSASGENIALYAADGTTLIDSVAFGPQRTDVACGRTTDGASDWSLFTPATPGAANASPLANWVRSSASFALAPVAPDSIASLFGTDLAASAMSASSLPLPDTLGSVSITVTDSAGVARSAPLFYVSPTQVNFQIPAGAAAGKAAIAVAKSDGSILVGDILIETVSPGVFAANGNGAGVGAMSAIRVDAQGAQTALSALEYSAAQQAFVGTAIPLGAETDSVYLVLYGTGIRGAGELSNVSALIGGTSVPVTYAGAQGSFAGLDQINLGPLPRTLAGAGEVEIVFTAGGTKANAVTAVIE